MFEAPVEVVHPTADKVAQLLYSQSSLPLEEKRIMRATLKNQLPAIICAVTPLFCYLLIRPYAEIGIGDDWAYTKTAQVLAQTGHIVYNGWGSPMMGWHAYFGALFIKLFGFSFTAVRFSTVLEAMATAWLMQRTCIRAGLNSWNATLTTLTLVLSSLYFSLACAFKTDIAGVLCLLACLYMCLRALQTQSERHAMAWISCAALVNAVGGTVRQIHWLGLLVMIPLTLWLLRKSRRVLVAGGISWFIGVIFIAVASHWLAKQPYVIPVPLFPTRIDSRALRILADHSMAAGLQLALLALPVLLMFSGTLRLWNRRAAAVVGVGILCAVASGFVMFRAHKLDLMIAPFIDSYMTDTSFNRLSAIAAVGIPLGHASDGLGWLFTGITVFAILCLAVCVFDRSRRPATIQQEVNPASWPKLGILLGPFTAAYFLVLCLTLLRNGLFFDRYLLPLFAILLLVLTRYYQERVKAKLPWASVLLIVVFAAFSVAATHDIFALFRGYATANEEILSSGVPPTAIAGPWELQGWTQIDTTGYINDEKIQIPRGAFVPQPARVHLLDCIASIPSFEWVPSIKPAYVITSDPLGCGGRVAFPPVMYSTWIAPRTNWIYALKLPPGFSS